MPAPDSLIQHVIDYQLDFGGGGAATLTRQGTETYEGVMSLVRLDSVFNEEKITPHLSLIHI